MRKYSVLDDTQFSMLDTDSFYEAVKYAKSSGWIVYDNERKIIVYDGLGDDLNI